MRAGDACLVTARRPTFVFEPIGYVRSPFQERAQAPRQPAAASEVHGIIELLPGRGYEHALEGLEGWEYAWVLFVFHRNVEQARGWKAKVFPPRASRKQGVFATRSPHRPNPIGLSAVAVVRVDGLLVHVRGIDLLDGTPVLDLKPYVAYADSFPSASAGWLEARDPLPPWEVTMAERAEAQLAWLDRHGVSLRAPILAVLSLGPEPRPYRRIRKRGTAFELAIKEWRVDFELGARPASAAGGHLVVLGVRSGYGRRQLVEGAGEGAPDPTTQSLHRSFAAKFQAVGL
jgi:tRNA-Thr(GGU) m(6)t(6)A37 methyltransferase TsaA